MCAIDLRALVGTPEHGAADLRFPSLSCDGSHSNHGEGTPSFEPISLLLKYISDQFQNSFGGLISWKQEKVLRRIDYDVEDKQELPGMCRNSG